MLMVRLRMAMAVQYIQPQVYMTKLHTVNVTPAKRSHVAAL